MNPISEIILGIKTLASGISHLILYPILILGVSIPAIITQLLYLGIVFWIIWKIVGDIKIWLAIIIFLIIISVVGNPAIVNNIFQYI